ncbi:CLUMA_CG013167, isoform A [Clunio marinus]|uniref:CLUMA_CG013167, isoform A n=1 Tax=Clunio marinus TaxID=568069 RepID=A0A1J1II38_9DIPT|nr:CLUMA_CG013167, isoform A [Clunio marinus]
MKPLSNSLNFMFCRKQSHDNELSRRIACAVSFSQFHILELCWKTYLLKTNKSLGTFFTFTQSFRVELRLKEISA